jgi:hypothetical protein
MAGAGRRFKRVLVSLGLGSAAVSVLTIVGCVRTSGGTWYFDEAPLPEGWPELTPVGEVAIRSYPTYRAAVVIDEGAGSGQGRMFGSLFKHISSNEIPMTAPVDMAYESSEFGADSDRMTAMAFLYRVPELGPLGVEGVVRVEDVSPRTYASIGVRGTYSDEHFAEGLTRVRAWLDEHDEWRPDGSPRYLGYNSPFVPWFWRYGEVQLPVVLDEDDVGG